MINRNIPNLDNDILKYLEHDVGYFHIDEVNLDDKLYVRKIEEYENKLEHKFINILDFIGVSSLVKQDKFSLPYTQEIISDPELNESDFVKDVIKKIIDTNVNRIRFYVLVEYKNNEDSFLKYIHFRYYIHK